MIHRTVWIKKIERLWRERSVVWLSGVRRSGKTCLCQTLENAEYFDCELPGVRRMLEDVESFWRRLSDRSVVLDEIHRLLNPSEVLKIAADHFPGSYCYRFFHIRGFVKIQGHARGQETEYLADTDDT